MNIQSILIIHRFHNHKFPCLLNLLVTPKTIFIALLWSFANMKNCENFDSSDAHVPSWGQTRQYSAFLLSP